MLPKPEHWRDNTVQLVPGFALFGGAGAFSAVWTVIFASRGDYLTAIITAGGTMFVLGLVLAAGWTELERVTVRGICDSRGLMLRPDRVITALWVIAFVAAVPSGLLYVVFVPRGEVSISMTRGEQIFTPYLVGFGLLFVVVGLIALVVRRGPGYVHLTPRGFELADILFTYRGTWTDITDITDIAPNKQKRAPIVIIMKTGPPHVYTGAKACTPGGAALYWMLRHYWLHPENRDELVDGRALERLHNEQFDAE
ncbi:hypothetical protein [Mycobacterium shimoidei]|uniref:Uncharacterized protein n=1 Tax=Mycobacterium shimoidei TaxID=29313 RepID=A0A375Z3A8_MYCSH|nr:hypothetical protein [Mycobacterium shimoidei]SRX95430.1 hypothetical protein MSP7336_03699 [Mycobacterium shimoidei]